MAKRHPSRAQPPDLDPEAGLLGSASGAKDRAPTDEAAAGGAAVIGTGRSDFPNQVNNVLAFPGIFRGALDARATHVTAEIRLAAASALAGMVPSPTAERILPSPLDRSVAPTVGKAVAAAWAG